MPKYAECHLSVPCVMKCTGLVVFDITSMINTFARMILAGMSSFKRCSHPP